MRPGATGELAELQAAVADLAKGLRITHAQLEAEVAARTAELSEAMQRIQLSDEEKGRLIARGNELVEDERRRISTEIHDDLNVVLVSIRMQAEALASAARESGQSEASAEAARMLQLIDSAYGRARAIVRKLRPEIIDALGLTGAVEETVSSFGALDRDCLFAFVSSPLPTVSESVSIAAYRMLQEALSNVVKHANARHCRVSLGASDKDRLTLIVEDDGRGFEVSSNSTRGLGLAGMRERAHALHGTLKIESVPGTGTRLTITLPIADT
jgi:two-component system sensor histidine kinase UhpB